MPLQQSYLYLKYSTLPNSYIEGELSISNPLSHLVNHYTFDPPPRHRIAFALLSRPYLVIIARGALRNRLVSLHQSGKNGPERLTLHV